MLPRIRLAPALAVAAAAVLAAGDGVWLGTRHPVPDRCRGVYAHSPWAEGLAIAGGVLAVASLVTVLADWVAENTSRGRRPARSKWRLSIVVAAIVLLATVVSLGAMYGDAALRFCL